MRRSSRRDVKVHALGTEAGFLKRDLVRARRQVNVDRAGRSRSCLERAGVALELEEDVGQGNVTLVTDVGYQQGRSVQDGAEEVDPKSVECGRSTKTPALSRGRRIIISR